MHEVGNPLDAIADFVAYTTLRQPTFREQLRAYEVGLPIRIFYDISTFSAATFFSNKGAFINYVTQQREIVLWGTFKCKRDRDWETALRNL